jgi:hypothetical protein
MLAGSAICGGDPESGRRMCASMACFQEYVFE